MRRTTPPTASLTTAGLLGLALLAPVAWASPAAAAAETCRGEVATIVGTGPTVTGTEGRDVIGLGAGVTLLIGTAPLIGHRIEKSGDIDIRGFGLDLSHDGRVLAYGDTRKNGNTPPLRACTITRNTTASNSKCTVST